MLLIAAPDGYRQAKTDAISMDIAPTVLDLPGVQTDEAFGGESLLVLE